MADRGDRDSFLAAVRSSLDLPDKVAQGVLEELAGHLEDVTAELRAAGLSAEDAERRAIGRLGDARALGSELARAHHGRRQLLAAVGGGIRAVLVEGIRAWVFVALLLSLTASLAMLSGWIVLQLMGRSSPSDTAGPVFSLVTVGAAICGFAYLGWILPVRIAGPAVRSVRGVRRAVAFVGLVVASAVLWFLVSIDMDPVLAFGLPFGPVAFALAALRAPDRPTFRVGLTPAVVAAAVFFFPMALLAVATATDPRSGDWMADTSPIGATLAPTNVEDSIVVDWMFPYEGPGETTVDAGDAANDLTVRFPTLQVEVWPARVVDGIVQFGAAPLVSLGAATEQVTTLHYSMPRLRDRMTTATFVVGIAPDGRRVILAENLDLARTPSWTGTLVDWWTGD